jgi:hypothetical protein
MIASTLNQVFPQTADGELNSNVIDDLYRSIQLLSDAHPMRSRFLASVGDIYFIRFRRSQCPSASWNDTQMHTYAVKYGTVLQHRFKEKGAVGDIQNSVSMSEEAVRLTPDGHPDKPSFLNNLGNSLLRRFERLGDPSDMTKSVSVKEEAVRLTPDGHPDKPSMLNSFGNSLLRRFQRLGDSGDMNQSVSVEEEAVTTDS